MSHIVRQADGTSVGIWGPFTLRSAFQPILASVDGKLSIIAYEGLIRPFRDDEAIEPEAFFSSLPEEYRLEAETLTRSLHLLNAGVHLEPEMSIFVNFDPSLFKQNEIVDKALSDMRLVLDEAGIDPARVVCEVIEKKSHSPAALRNCVKALRGHGYRIAVDDYGAESSNFRRIKELSPDIVKFDAKWITDLMESGPGLALLTTMAEEFAAKGIETVFEGIEESWQIELAERSGASMVQGFALARPELVSGESAAAKPKSRRAVAPRRPVTPRPS